MRPLISIVCAALACLATAAVAQDNTAKQLPPELDAWRDWATWDQRHDACPSPYNNAQTRLCFWPSRLKLDASADAGAWQLGVTVYAECWVPLPGDPDHWPQAVKSGDQALVVVERDKRPQVKLPPGEYTLTGAFNWSPMPQKLRLPREIGLIALTVDAQEVELPNWDADGYLWLRRTREQAAAKDQLTRRVYRVLEDGAPLWLRTEIELKVSGKSREETLGTLLPDGWRLATIDSQLPVAVDERGVVKVQVRAGQWTVAAHAFRTHDLATLAYADDAQPMVKEELVAFRSAPQFRVAELQGAPAIDATQTTFPDKWRSLPVYQWKTNETAELVEQLRGMGEQADAGLRVDRVLWLDEDGRNATYRDHLRGDALRVWRLDAAAGQELGSVRIGNQSQLITKNPATGEPGVEVRDRQLNLQAVGRMPVAGDLPATGWQADAEGLSLMLNLPPGWRLLALFGADRVDGDWLTAWTLLDLFLLLVFATAVLRVWGPVAGLVALLAFGLAYHEPGAPRLSWLFLLAPIALLRVVGDGIAMRLLLIWKHVALVLLVLIFVPFAFNQVQSALYPQLEPQGIPYRQHVLLPWQHTQYAAPAAEYYAADEAQFGKLSTPNAAPSDMPARSRSQSLLGRAAGRELERVRGDRDQERQYYNLKQSPQAVIQTGFACPTWTWNRVVCSWSGPVDASQSISPVLIPPTVHRLLSVARVALLVLLAAVLLGVRLPMIRPRSTAAAAIAFAMLGAPSAQAEYPPQTMLDTLHERLLEPNDAFPNAAEIPTASLRVDGGRLALTAEVHAAARAAVPLPGRFPSWSPLSVVVDGQDTPALRREDGYLWVTLDPGVHQMEVAGLLPEVSEWEWTYLLRPRRVQIDAAEWTVTGVKPDGSPENQVFFVRKQQRTPGEAAYDQKHFAAAVVVDRTLEIGLVWKLHTTVTRLSQPGKAVSLSVPLVEGERVLSASNNVEEDHINVRLAAGQTKFRWESELSIRPTIDLAAADSDQYVEHWRLMLSPVWNVKLDGLPPIFEPGDTQLQPVWKPWPGENATLAFSRPESVDGRTVTIHKVDHTVALGARQRTATLALDIECSLANDFLITLPEDAQVTALQLAGREIPVRRDDRNLIVPARPGRQGVRVDWKQSTPLATTATSGELTLPVDSANVSTTLHPPGSRWVLWADGPLRGPAVRFWTLLAVSLIVALVLGALKNSPLRWWEWVLLSLGLTQVHVAGALLVVSWLMLFAWRGRLDPHTMGAASFNLLQALLVMLTVAALGVLVVVVGEGLLGDPRMFIVGNGSSPDSLRWFAPRSDATLPVASVVSVSVWWYRLLMLFWALWLASALVGWLKRSWSQFTHIVAYRKLDKKIVESAK